MAQLTSLSGETEGLANKLNRMGNTFEKEIQRLETKQGRLYNALEVTLISSWRLDLPPFLLHLFWPDPQVSQVFLSWSIQPGWHLQSRSQQVQKLLGLSNPAALFNDKLVSHLLSDGNVHLREFFPRHLAPSSESTLEVEDNYLQLSATIKSSTPLQMF